MSTCPVILRFLPLSLPLLLASCQREARDFRPSPNVAQTVSWVQTTDFVPGGKPADQIEDGVAMTPDDLTSGYENNAYAISEGKRLYEAFNCYGCHSYGGGDIGPPLMDEKWIYGGRPAQIFATIVQGRPNGMPAFGRRVPAYQIWQIVAYVESLSGRVQKDAAPGRNDDMHFPPPENSRDEKPAVDSSSPASGERPE